MWTNALYWVIKSCTNGPLRLRFGLINTVLNTKRGCSALKRLKVNECSASLPSDHRVCDLLVSCGGRATQLVCCVWHNLAAHLGQFELTQKNALSLSYQPCHLWHSGSPHHLWKHINVFLWFSPKVWALKSADSQSCSSDELRGRPKIWSLSFLIRGSNFCELRQSSLMWLGCKSGVCVQQTQKNKFNKNPCGNTFLYIRTPWVNTWNFLITCTCIYIILMCSVTIRGYWWCILCQNSCINFHFICTACSSVLCYSHF